MVESGVTLNKPYQLIVTVVKKGVASKVVAASKKAGAEGGTIFFGRGTADRDIYLHLLGIEYEPEKEVILTFVEKSMTDTVLQAITDTAKLNKPGNGIGFVLELEELAGVCHLLQLQ